MENFRRFAATTFSGDTVMMMIKLIDTASIEDSTNHWGVFWADRGGLDVSLISSGLNSINPKP